MTIDFVKRCFSFLWEYDVEENVLLVHHDGVFDERGDQNMSVEELRELFRNRCLSELDMEVWDSCMSDQHLKEFFKGTEDKKSFIIAVRNKDDEIAWHKVLMQKQNFSKVLLTGTEVTEIMREKQQCEISMKRRLGYLQNMPVACCAIEVLLDCDGEPCDFRFTYANRAHEVLTGAGEGELVGKKFSDVFENADPEWNRSYYKTAYEGIPQVFRRYSPEVDKYLLIHTFQIDKGSCGSVMLDVSEEYYLSQELKRSREEMKNVLAETTALVFQYYPDSERVNLTKLGEKEPYKQFKVDRLLANLKEKKLLENDHLEIVQNAFNKIKDGCDNVSVTIRARKECFFPFNWYRLTLFDFRDGTVDERKVLGYMQNIEAEVSKQEIFRKQAQRDSLTGVMNVGTGRRMVEKKLEKQKDFCCNAMFLVDIDDFKNINDTRGHMVGDEVLKAFASALEKTFRADDIIYRLGGDEFVAFVADIRECGQCIDGIMERFQVCMERVRKDHPYLYSSVGIYVSDKHCGFEEFYREADKALYEAKNAGKNTYKVIRDLRCMSE